MADNDDGVLRGTGTGVSWPMLALIVSFAGAIGFIAYWLGQQSQQIAINSSRIMQIEKHDLMTRDREQQIIIDSIRRDADIAARLSVLEHMRTNGTAR